MKLKTTGSLSIATTHHSCERETLRCDLRFRFRLSFMLYCLFFSHKFVIHWHITHYTFDIHKHIMQYAKITFNMDPISQRNTTIGSDKFRLRIWTETVERNMKGWDTIYKSNYAISIVIHYHYHHYIIDIVKTEISPRASRSCSDRGKYSNRSV